MLLPCSSFLCLPCRCGVACNLLFILSATQSSHIGNNDGTKLGFSELQLNSLDTSIPAYFHPHSTSLSTPTLTILEILAWPFAFCTGLVLKVLNPMTLLTALCQEPWFKGFSALTWLVVITTTSWRTEEKNNNKALFFKCNFPLLPSNRRKNCE